MTLNNWHSPNWSSISVILGSGWNSFNVTLFKARKSTTILYFCFPVASIFLATNKSGEFQGLREGSIIIMCVLYYVTTRDATNIIKHNKN